MNNVIQIDGVWFPAPLSLTASADFLDKEGTSRTMSGSLHRELIGVYSNYEAVFREGLLNPTDFERLWELLSRPVDFHRIVAPLPGDRYHEFEAYVSANKTQVKGYRANGNPYWKDLSVSFKAKEPYRRP